MVCAHGDVVGFALHELAVVQDVVADLDLGGFGDAVFHGGAKGEGVSCRECGLVGSERESDVCVGTVEGDDGDDDDAEEGEGAEEGEEEERAEVEESCAGLLDGGVGGLLVVAVANELVVDGLCAVPLFEQV